MTDEEKEAIEFLKENIKGFDDEFLNKTYSEAIERQRTILNLIEKQDKMIDLMAERIYRCENYNPYLEWCPNWKRILRESAEEIKEKYRKKVQNEK